MKIKNSFATLDITITEDLRNQIPKNGSSLVFTCVIVKPNKDNDAEILDIDKGTIIIPKGFEIVQKMENSVLLNGTVGSTIQIEYNIEDKSINVKVKEAKGTKTEEPAKTNTISFVEIPQTVPAELNAAAKAAAEAENKAQDEIMGRMGGSN